MSINDPTTTGNPLSFNGWLRFLPRTKKGWTFLLAVLFALILLPGVTKPSPELRELKGSSGNLPPYKAFLVDPEDKTAEGSQTTDYSVLPQYQSASILRDFEVVLALHNLTPGKIYNASISVFDAKRKAVIKDSTLTFTPESKNFFIYNLVSPEYKNHKAGKWQAVFALDGVGKLKHNFVIAPPLPHEEKALQQYEKAQEIAYRGFAHYWYGVEHPDSVMFLTSLDSGENNRSGILNESRFFQVAGVDHEFYDGTVSEADQLNGITFRSKVQMRFRVFRTYHPENGWTKWIDVKRPNSDHAALFGEMWRDFFEEAMRLGDFIGTGSLAFTGRPLTFAMRFEIFEQDGNWVAVSDLGHLFVNGERRNPAELMPERYRKKEEAKKVVKDTPLPRDVDLIKAQQNGQISYNDLSSQLIINRIVREGREKRKNQPVVEKKVKEPKLYPETFDVLRPLILCAEIYQPDVRAATLVLKNEKTPRELAKELGDIVRADPKATKAQVEHTMKILKGLRW